MPLAVNLHLILTFLCLSSYLCWYSNSTLIMLFKSICLKLINVDWFPIRQCCWLPGYSFKHAGKFKQSFYHHLPACELGQCSIWDNSISVLLCGLATAGSISIPETRPWNAQSCGIYFKNLKAVLLPEPAQRVDTNIKTVLKHASCCDSRPTNQFWIQLYALFWNSELALTGFFCHCEVCTYCLQKHSLPNCACAPSCAKSWFIKTSWRLLLKCCSQTICSNCLIIHLTWNWWPFLKWSPSSISKWTRWVLGVGEYNSRSELPTT